MIMDHGEKSREKTNNSAAIMSAGRKRLLLDEGVDDTICGLPRHVLDKIFDRLPVKDAARTSILSRKWRYLWSAYPYLVFDKQFFEKIFANYTFSCVNKYINLIYKVLLGHDGPVLKFYLYIPNFLYNWDEHIDEWLSFLSRNGIRKLILFYEGPTPYKLPSYVFSSPKLTNLVLTNLIFKPPVSFSGFAYLVELHLTHVTIADCAFYGFTPVAPLLNMLIFKNCAGVKFFNIFTPRVSVLAVQYSSEVAPTFFEKYRKLYYIRIVIGDILKVAYQGKGSLMNLCELHEKFPKVRILDFDGCYLKLSAATSIERRLSFVFLRCLRLYLLSFDDLDQISCALWLFNSSPNLETVEASVSPSKNNAVESILTRLESPHCMGKMLKLRTVKLNFVEGSKPEMLFIKCILAHSPNLEYLHVKYSVVDEGQQLRISNELMRFPRVSSKAQIIYAR